MNAQDMITEHLDIWTTAQEPKKPGGRGRGKKKNGQSLYGIKKLRELILDLAVRGKLVEQNPEDEPASVLLEKIAAEKAWLVKEGKIKKQKKLPEITEEEKPFDLPDGWEWVRLQDVSKYIQRGKGPKYSDQGNVRVVSQKCVQWSGFTLQQARFVDDASLMKYQPERFLQNDDLLWNSTGTGTVGRINVLSSIKPNTLVADSHLTVIRLLHVSRRFLWCYLAGPYIQLRIDPDHENSLVSGTTKQVELNTGTIQPLICPLPPLLEQHRIVTKVDELMALCDQLEQQQTTSNATHQTLLQTLLATLIASADHEAFTTAWERIASHFDLLFTTEQSIDQLKQTILQLAVMGKLVPQHPEDEPASLLLEKIAKEKARLIKEGKIKKQKKLPEITEEEKPFALPEGWEWVRLGTSLKKITDGTHHSPPNGEQGDFLYISAKNIKQEGVLLSNATYVTRQIHEEIYGRCDPEYGDILFIKDGATTGIVTVNNLEEPFSMLSSVALLKLPKGVLNYFMLLLLRGPVFYQAMRAKMTGVAITRVTLEKLNYALMPLPPLAEQHRIVAKVDELMALCDHLKTRLHKNQTTKLQLADTIVKLNGDHP